MHSDVQLPKLGCWPMSQKMAEIGGGQSWLLWSKLKNVRSKTDEFQTPGGSGEGAGQTIPTTPYNAVVNGKGAIGERLFILDTCVPLLAI